MTGKSASGNARQNHARDCVRRAACTCGRRGAHDRTCVRSKRCTCGARWQARITTPSGATINAPRTFLTRIDAEAWLVAERRRMENVEEYRPPVVRAVLAREAAERAERNRPPTFAAYSERWLRERKVKGRPLAPETVRKHRTQLDLRLLPVFGSLRLDEITPQFVNRFYDDLIEAGCTPKVLRETYSTGSAIMATAVSAHGPLVGSVSPFAIRGAGSGLTPKRHNFATAEEVAKIVSLMPTEMQVVVLLAAWCGLRVGEIQALRRSDVDIDGAQPVVLVRRSYDPHARLFGPPKSEEGIRDQHVPEHVVPALRSLLNRVVTGRDGLLFPSQRNIGHPMARDLWNGRLRCEMCTRELAACVAAQKEMEENAPSRHDFAPIRNGWYAARYAIGRTDLHFHDLRAAGATQLARIGYQVSEIQAWLGDSTPEAAMRYIRATDDRKIRMAADLSRIAAEGAAAFAKGQPTG